MNNITNLTLSDITVKNCQCGKHMNATILVKECTNVQWTKITVDSISSSGIIGINILGDSCFFYIKSHMMSINYSDTQLTQNKSNHTVLIDQYVIGYSSSKAPVLNFMFLQHSYGVKFQLTNMICQLNHKEKAVYIIFNAKSIYQNKLIIKNIQFIHNSNVTYLLYIRESSELSNNIVEIKNCVFSYNTDYYGSIIMFYGQIKSVLISSCKFYSNKIIKVIYQSSNAIISQMITLKLFPHFVIENTNFSSINSKDIIFIWY